jgi:hypothetical protein
MAQKTPVPALTIDTTGTWTSLWYYEFSELQNQWAANLQLHYVINAYFAAKHRLVHNLAILQNNQVVHCNAQLVVLPAMTLGAKGRSRRPARSGITSSLQRALARATPTAVNPANITINSTLQQNWLRMARQSWRQLSVKTTAVTGSRAFAAQTFCYRWLQSTGFNQTSLALPIRRAARVFSPRRRVWLTYRTQKSTGAVKRRAFSTQTTPTLLPVYYNSIAPAVINAANVVSYQVTQVTPVLPRALYQRWWRDRAAFRRLRPRKKRSFMAAASLLMARRSRSLVYRQRYARRFLKLSHLVSAVRHITTWPVQLTVRRYVCRTRFFKHLRHRAVFSRWARQWYFLPTVVLVLVALMRGSAALLLNWVLRLLKSAKKHSAILYLLSAAFKYFLYQPNTAQLVTHLPCCGVRLEVVGKIDGQDRAQTFKIQVGAIPTSTLSAPLDVEYGACGTIYGILGVWLWFFMRAQPLVSQTVWTSAPQPVTAKIVAKAV